MNNAIEIIANRNSDACNLIIADRAKCQSPQERNRFHKRSYEEGRAVAYNEAHKIIRNELEALKLKFQNGCLSMSDFDTF